ncbi:MAG: hypothetical protein AB7F31_05865 [Parachlamydiales bacterium]
MNAINWLKEHREETRFADQAFKLTSYTGRMLLLAGVPGVSHLVPVAKLRDIVWGLNAIRDLSSLGQWISEWDQKDNWTRFERVVVTFIRINFLTKSALRVAALFSQNPYLLQVKRASTIAAMCAVLVMDGEGVVKTLWKREEPSHRIALSLIDNAFDFANTSMDLELLPADEIPYAVTGFISAVAGFTSASLDIYNKKCR